MLSCIYIMYFCFNLDFFYTYTYIHIHSQMLSCIYIMYFCFNLDFFIQRQFVIFEFEFDKKKIKYLDYWFDDIKTHCLHDFIF